MQNVFEPAPLFTDAVGYRHFQSVNKQLVGIDSFATHFFNLANINFAAVEISMKQTQPHSWFGNLFQWRGARQQENFLSHLCGRNPDFLAIDDIAITIPHSSRF